MTSRDRIVTQTLKLLGDAPHGIRWIHLIGLVREALPQIPKNTIVGVLWNLDAKLPDRVFKPARGLWMDTKFREAAQVSQAAMAPSIKEKVAEKAFYGPFASWLVNELEECTKAIEVGGNAFKDKWGTPDVIGIREPKKSDIIKFEAEIISAEIKLDSAGLITAFGQSCAYRLFSHKSYIVGTDRFTGRRHRTARFSGTHFRNRFDPVQCG